MVKIIAHRGASGQNAVENTIESFRKAIVLGVDMVEFDVRQTKDKVLVVYHDKNFADTPIAWQTYSNIEKEASLKGFHVPLFREVLELCHDRVFMDIEIKEHGFEKKVLRELQKYADIDEYSIKSFDDRVSYAIKKMNPEIKTGLLIGKSNVSFNRKVNEFFPVRRLKKCKADFVSPNYKLLRFGFLRRMKRAGYPVYVWTVNEKSSIDRYLRKDIEALITDRPDIALEERMIID